jgi:hypothetical protein
MNIFNGVNNGQGKKILGGASLKSLENKGHLKNQ